MAQKLVIDTSVIVKWLSQTNEKDVDKADQIMESAIKGKIELIAPELSKYEFGNVLLKGKQLTPNQANISLGTAYGLPINFVSQSEELALETYKIAYNAKITYYDSTFLALAKQYGAILVTENIKHQGILKGIKVKSLRDY
jgi:predicted nucleic acid-binding protein